MLLGKASIRLLSFLLLPLAAQAFKVPTHIAVVNAALDEISQSMGSSGSAGKLVFHGLEMPISNREAFDAVFANPDYFRMGVTGPDAFPDMVSGQMYLHTNNGETSDEEVEARVLHENRTKPSNYRSIDYAMRMLAGARASGDGRNIAFALGYVGHCLGDGFAHTWVNKQAGGFFNYFGGEGLFGTFTEEVKHIAAEGLIDKHLPHALTSTNPPIPVTGSDPGSDYNRMALQAPYDFLDAFFNTKQGGEYMGGALYEYFDLQLGILDGAGDAAGTSIDFLSGAGDFLPGSSDAVTWMIGQIPGMAALIPYGAVDVIMGFVGAFTPANPVTSYFSEVEDNFDDMKEKIKAYRRNWMVMSKCTMENVVKSGAVGNPDNCTEVNNDAHLSYMAVDGSDLTLFKSEIQETFELASGKDHHSVADNADRAMKYLGSSFKLLSFDELLIPSDLRLGWMEFRNWLESNDNVLVDALLWGPATALAEFNCAIDGTVCATSCFVDCPGVIAGCISDRTSWCVDNLGAGSDFLCGLNPVCGLCVAGASAWCIGAEGPAVCLGCHGNCVWDFAQCTAANLFDFDGSKKLFQSIDDLVAHLDFIKEAIMEEVTKVACDAAKAAGAPLEQIHRIARIYHTLEALSNSGKYGMVNFAFLKEDVQNQAWFDRLVAEGSGTGLAALLQGVRDGSVTEFIGGSEAAIPIEVPDNCLDFSYDPGGAFDTDTRFGLFAGAASFFTQPGPTAARFLVEFGDNLAEDFVPFYNAIQGTKLLPVQGAGDVNALFAAQSVDNSLLPWNSDGANVYSAVCRNNTSAINLYCDVIPSLDDPDCIDCVDKPIADGLEGNLEMQTVLHDGSPVRLARRRSVVPNNDYDPLDAGWTPNVLTAFPLSSTQDAYEKVYAKIFRVPAPLPKFAGFDDEGKPWTSDQADLSLDPTIKTQGTASLKVCGNGWMVLQSPVFNTVDFGVTSSEITFDIWIPDGQSNPYWVGSVAMVADVQSAGIYSMHLGQVELTPLTRGAWNEVSFTIPEALREALAGDFPNAQLLINLNVSPAGDCYRIDNMRITGDDVETRREPHRIGSRHLNVIGNSVFSFDQFADWSASNPGSALDPVIKEEGAASRSVVGAGWQEVRSVPFSTTLLAGITDKLNVDLYVPDPQPNKWWVGDLSAVFNCPEAQVHNQYLGLRPLTHTFRNEFNSMVFDLPANVLQAMRAVHDGCTIQLNLNVNQGSGQFKFDKMGFVNAAGSSGEPAPTPDPEPPDPPGTGSGFVCSGPCASAQPIGAGGWDELGTTGEVWYVLSGSIGGWQASEMTGRTIRVNGIEVVAGQMPLPPAAADGKWYFQFTAGNHPWASWSLW